MPSMTRGPGRLKYADPSTAKTCAAADRRQVVDTRPAAASAPSPRRSPARWKPHGIRRSISGSTSATASQVVWRDRSPVRAQEVPAARPADLLRHPVADRERRIEPLEADDPRGAAGRASRRSATFCSTAPRRSRSALDDIDRGVLDLGHRADRRDRVEDPLDRGGLERDDRDVGVDRAGRPR